MICKYSDIFCWKNVSSFCSAKATHIAEKMWVAFAKATHIFSAKNIRILCIESAKTVNEMTLNELVKLTTLWTTGPWCYSDRKCATINNRYLDFFWRALWLHWSKDNYLKDILSFVNYGSIVNNRSKKQKFVSVHDKTYNKTCVTSSKYSDQPIYLPTMARVMVYPSLDSLEVVEGTCDQQKLWSDCADAQADLSLRWSHKSYCRFCRALAQILEAQNW